MGLVACTEESNDIEAVKAAAYSLSGKVEKGPFVRGSSISVQPLNELMTAVGTVYNGEITNDEGNFDLGKVELASQFVRLSADGYYFNEVSGALSNGTLHLVALADLSDNSTVNVNILTHLKSARVQKLVAAGKSFRQANAQAQEELLTQFGLQKYSDNLSEKSSITTGDNSAAVLITISSLVLAQRSDAEVTQYLSTLSQDLADDGVFNDANKAAIASDVKEISGVLEQIKENIISRYSELGREITVPDLRNFIDWDGDGAAGNEYPDNPLITLSQTEVNFGKDGGTAEVTVDANFKFGVEPFGDSVCEPDQVWSSDGIFEPTQPLSVAVTLEKNIITIVGGANRSNKARSYTVNIYNVFDDVVASIAVNFEADPDFKAELTSSAKAAIMLSVTAFVDVMADIYKLECSYTGIMEYSKFSAPLNPGDNKLLALWSECYKAIRNFNMLSYTLADHNLYSLADILQTYTAILYTRMIDLWGDLPHITYQMVNNDDFYLPKENAYNISENSLQMLLSSLEIASDTKFNNNPESQSVELNVNPGTGSRASTDYVSSLIFLPKDVLHLAIADIYLQRKDYKQALFYYQKVAANYDFSNTLDFTRANPENIFSPMKESISRTTIDTVPIYFYTDVVLRMAECCQNLEQYDEMGKYIKEIKAAHSEFDAIDFNEPSTIIIDSMRRKAQYPAYLGWLKRSNLGIDKYEFEKYQLLWPIPEKEVMLNPSISQNPGY